LHAVYREIFGKWHPSFTQEYSDEWRNIKASMMANNYEPNELVSFYANKLQSARFPFFANGYMQDTDQEKLLNLDPNTPTKEIHGMYLEVFANYYLLGRVQNRKDILKDLPSSGGSGGGGASGSSGGASGSDGAGRSSAVYFDLSGLSQARASSSASDPYSSSFSQGSAASANARAPITSLAQSLLDSGIDYQGTAEELAIQLGDDSALPIAADIAARSQEYRSKFYFEEQEYGEYANKCGIHALNNLLRHPTFCFSFAIRPSDQPGGRCRPGQINLFAEYPAINEEARQSPLGAAYNNGGEYTAPDPSRPQADFSLQVLVAALRLRSGNGLVMEENRLFLGPEIAPPTERTLGYLVQTSRHAHYYAVVPRRDLPQRRGEYLWQALDSVQSRGASPILTLMELQAWLSTVPPGGGGDRWYYRVVVKVNMPENNEVARRIIASPLNPSENALLHMGIPTSSLASQGGGLSGNGGGGGGGGGGGSGGGSASASQGSISSKRVLVMCQRKSGPVTDEHQTPVEDSVGRIKSLVDAQPQLNGAKIEYLSDEPTVDYQLKFSTDARTEQFIDRNFGAYSAIIFYTCPFLYFVRNEGIVHNFTRLLTRDGFLMVKGSSSSSTRNINALLYDDKENGILILNKYFQILANESGRTIVDSEGVPLLFQRP
jgi:uncharacterized membrane protein YgcG